MTNTFLQDFFQNLRAGFRLMTFQRVSLWDFRFGLDQFILLTTAYLSLTFGSSYFKAVPHASFNVYSIPVYALDLCWQFLVAYLISKWIKKSEATLNVLTIYSSFAFYYILITIIADLFANNQFKYLYELRKFVFPAFAILVVWRIYYLSTQKYIIVTCVAVALFCATAGISQRYYKNYNNFWYSVPESDSEERNDYTEYEKLDAEALMYKQHTMLDKTLAELKPQRKKHSDIFFVGFAPYAMQDVFYKEITYAKDLMDKRFDTQGHSINLINHLKTTDKLPLATSTNLSHTLKRIGKLMDKDEDVLVLYLTSHGSQKHELSVDFYPLALNDLTPIKLKTMLDEAGIKWRVVIISACYSGGYIKPLQSTTTLVATAAAADKTSFGCGNEFDFTYFGQAFFKDQLTKQTSLISALKQADIEIGKREIREKKEPSKPQLSVGAEIEDKLNSLEKAVTAYQCGKKYQAVSKC